MVSLSNSLELFNSPNLIGLSWLVNLIIIFVTLILSQAGMKFWMVQGIEQKVYRLQNPTLFFYMDKQTLAEKLINTQTCTYRDI